MKLFTGLAIGASLVYTATIFNIVQNDLEQVEQTIQASVEQNQRVELRQQTKVSVDRSEFYKAEIECLAKNMYFEARGEGERGQTAVAFVTINRVRSNKYPNTVCEVVYQAKTNSRGVPLRNQCQFSWYCDGKVDTVTERIYNRIERRAEYIYVNYHLNDMMKDTTDGATHYHNNKVNPYWSRHENYQYVASIGQHIFYQPTY